MRVDGGGALPPGARLADLPLPHCPEFTVAAAAEEDSSGRVGHEFPFPSAKLEMFSG